MADVQGSIIIEADLDPKGFDRGSKEMVTAIKSLHSQVEKLGPTFQKAMSGNASAMKQFDTKAASLENTIKNIVRSMEQLSTKAVPTEEYQWLSDAISKAEKQLQRMQERQDQLGARGVSESSKQWQNLEADIEHVKNMIYEYKLEQEQLRNSGDAFISGAETAQFQQLQADLDAVLLRFAEMRQAAAGSAAETAAGMEQTGGVVRTVVVPALKDGVRELFNFRKVANSIEQSVGKLTRRFTGIFSRIRTRISRQFISRIFSGLREGISNVTTYIPEVQSAMDSLNGSLGALKNSVGAAVAPLITALAPALTTIINLCVEAVTWIGQLIAALTGATTFNRATKAQEGYAKALSGSAGAAKELKRQLAGFDELNILSDDKGGGGGGGGADVSGMFEEVEINSSISSLVDRLKEAWNNKDFSELGRIIGEKFNELWGMIDWAGSAQAISTAAIGILQFFTGAIDGVDWRQVGRDIATFLTEIDWKGLLSAVGGLIAEVFEGFADMAVGAFQVIIPKMQKWAKNFDAKKALKGIGDKMESAMETFASQASKSWARTFAEEPEVDMAEEQVDDMIEILGRAIQSGSKWKESLERDKTAIERCGYSVEDFTTGGVQGLQNAYRMFSEKYAPNMDKSMNGTKTIFERIWEILKKLNEIFGFLLPKTSTFTEQMKQLGIIEDTTAESTDRYTRNTDKQRQATEQATTKTDEYAESVDGLNTSMSNMKDKKVTVTMDGKTTPAYDSGTSRYEKANNKKVTLTADGSTTQSYETTTDRYSKVDNKKSTVTVSAEKAAGFDSVMDDYNSLTSKTITTTAKIKIDSSFLTPAEKRAAGLDVGTGGVISSYGRLTRFAGGGSVAHGRGTWFDRVAKYAAGGTAHGTVFVAGEAGPEIMGHVNGKTEILNLSQIAQAIHSAVVSGLTQVLAHPIAVSLIPSVSGANAPLMASGGVLPYEIGRQVLSALTDVSTAIDAQTVDLISAMTQNRQALAQAIVQALQGGGARGGMDARSIASDLNRQSRLLGRSVIAGG